MLPPSPMTELLPILMLSVLDSSTGEVDRVGARYGASTPWLTTTLELTSPSLRLTMELAPYLAPTLSTSPTAESSTSTTKLMTSLEMLPPSPMTELPHTLTLSVLLTLSSDMPSPTL